MTSLLNVLSVGQSKILPYLSMQEQANLATSLALNHQWRKVAMDKVTGMLQCLRDLKYFAPRSEENAPIVYMCEAGEKGCHAEKLYGIVGMGGSKQAIKLANGRVLMMPQLETRKQWKWIVALEVGMSDYFSSLGLMSQRSKRVMVASTAKPADGTMPAYVSESYESLAKKGVFIYDSKNQDRCTWVFEKSHLFKTDQDRLKECNWDAVFELLLDDVAKMHVYNLPVSGDSVNYAVVQRPDSTKSAHVSEFQVRYFGFDLAIEVPKKNTSMPSTYTIEILKQFLIADFIDLFFLYDFGRPRNQDKDVLALKELLTEKYTKIVLEKIAALIKPAAPANALVAPAGAAAAAAKK